MSEFKAGDRVFRISDPYDCVPIGHSSEVACSFSVNVDGNYMWINEKVWQLEERHVHHDLIIAWAKGAKIQYYSEDIGEWTNTAKNNPSWHPDLEYRIKPAPQTTEERITELEATVKEMESRL